MQIIQAAEGQVNNNNRKMENVYLSLFHLLVLKTFEVLKTPAPKKKKKKKRNRIRSADHFYFSSIIVNLSVRRMEQKGFAANTCARFVLHVKISLLFKRLCV